MKTDCPPDLIGRRFGSLLVIGDAPRKDRRRYWRVRCDCGTEMDKRWTSIRDGSRCGRCTPITHGHSRRGQITPEYGSWAAMIQRCKNTNNPHYATYGAAGINVCERWENFENFLADMGQKPSPKYEIERVDNSQGYNPNNCIWETRRRQNLNKKKTLKVIFRGKEMPLMDACEISGIPYNVAKQRLRKLGWSEELALTTPPLSYGQRKPK